MKKNKIEYGKKNLVSEDLDPADAKVKVTMYLDGDVLLEVQNKAKKVGKKYQTFLNEFLRVQFLKQSTSQIDPVDLLEKAVVGAE